MSFLYSALSSLDSNNNSVNMADVKEFVTGFVGSIIAIVVAVSMLPVLVSTIASANLSGTEAVLVGLSTLLVAVGILLFIVKSFF